MARPSPLPLGRLALEDLASLSDGDAGAVVGHLDVQPAVDGGDRAAHQATVGRVLERVGQQVGDDREDLLLVDPRAQLSGRLEHEPLPAHLRDAGEALAA